MAHLGHSNGNQTATDPLWTSALNPAVIVLAAPAGLTGGKNLNLDCKNGVTGKAQSDETAAKAKESWVKVNKRYNSSAVGSGDWERAVRKPYWRCWRCEQKRLKSLSEWIRTERQDIGLASRADGGEKSMKRRPKT